MNEIETLPEGTLYPFLRIPCSRHDVGENDPRVRLMLGCVLGHICSLEDEDIVREFTFFLLGIVRLHDHKGTLFVVSKVPIPPDFLEVFEQFWRRLDIWGGLGVEACIPEDEIWEEVWGMKRFESAWTPSAPH